MLVVGGVGVDGFVVECGLVVFVGVYVGLYLVVEV